jgi:hypothetical protein
VAAAGVIGLSLAGPAAAQPVPDCLPPAGTGATGEETLTNRLVTPETIPDPVRLERGGDPERYVLELETELRHDPKVESNFEVIARLKAPDGTTIEDDALVVTAAAENERRIKVSVCLDPAPPSGTLDAGEYRAAIEFIDPRIPETALVFDVWVGGASEGTYVALAVAVGALLLVVPPALIALQARLSGRAARAELQRVLGWLGLLLIVALAGYLWAVFAFRETDRYHLWSLSGGWQEFLGFAFGKIGMTVTGFVAVLAFVPQFRQALGEALPSVPPATTPEATEARLPPADRPWGGAPAAGRPTRAPAGGRRLAPAIAAVAGVLALIGGVVALSGDDGEQDAGLAPPTTDEPGEPPDVAPEDVLGELDVGTTAGDEAAARLREIGFVVFDYLVCSNSTGEPGLLRQVRETESGEVVVDSDGPTSLAGDVDPPAALDVLITSGEPCDT